jgi:uncharacterized membrane protein
MVAGEATEVNGLWRAFPGTAETGMEDIDTLGGPESAAYSVSSDGSVIVGASLTGGLSESNEAFIWTATTGMQELRTALNAAGVHTADDRATLAAANSVSADGTIIVGYGRDEALSLRDLDSVSSSPT